MGDEDELTAVRRRWPVGTRARGRVSDVPAGAGRAGVAVDLGDPVPGWVDMLLLPDEKDRWPPVGRTGVFEVLQHLGDEIRLFPLDAGMRGERCRQLRWSGAGWAAVSRRWPVGTAVEATVDQVYPGIRSYTVRFADSWSTVEYDGPPPEAGAVVGLVVVRQSEWTQTIVMRPAGPPASPGPAPSGR